MPSVGVLSLFYSTPSITLSDPFISPSPCFSTAFSTHLYILYLHILWYAKLLMPCHSLFLSLFPEFHRAVPLLSTRSTSEFVYDHACFCVYVYLWFRLPRMRENMHLLSF
jgi:hypothetical protein